MQNWSDERRAMHARCALRLRAAAPSRGMTSIRSRHPVWALVFERDPFGKLIAGFQIMPLTRSKPTAGRPSFHRRSDERNSPLNRPQFIAEGIVETRARHGNPLKGGGRSNRQTRKPTTARALRVHRRASRPCRGRGWRTAPAPGDPCRRRRSRCASPRLRHCAAPTRCRNDRGDS